MRRPVTIPVPPRAGHTSAAAASQPPTLAAGRKPTARAMAATTMAPVTVWITLPSTCPVSTGTRVNGMVRNRLRMPSVMSMLTATAVDTEAELTASTMIPGVR